MKLSHLLSVLLATLIAVSVLCGVGLYYVHPAKEASDVFVGIYAGSTELEDLQALANEVKDYTNLFIVGSLAITLDYDKLTQICQQLNSYDLNFMIFEHPHEDMPFALWVSEAKQKWNQNFLGLYAYDEPGGYQIERTEFMAVKQADDYADAAEKYVANVTNWLNQLRDYSGESLPMYVSDYVFYEYDYRAGYDAVFAQFGWNFSRPLQAALCRGAATVHDKPWGVIITYENTQPPYYESGEQMYQDMVYAYENGAKYILLFDYDKNTTRKALTSEHLAALRQFWQYTQSNPQTSSNTGDRIAFVLPKDYGFGFRSSNDRIWGIWEADEMSAKIWEDVNSLLQQHKTKLDIIYEDTLHLNTTAYNKFVFWNGTTQTP